MFNRARVAANYAIQSLARSAQREFQIYAYSILPQKEEDLGASPVRCLYGLVSVKDDRTLDEEDFLYAVIHFGGLDFRCSVKPCPNEGEYESILAALQDSIEEQNTIKMVRVLDEKFGTDYFGLEDVLKDLRASIALDISRKTLGSLYRSSAEPVQYIQAAPLVAQAMGNKDSERSSGFNPARAERRGGEPGGRHSDA